MAVLVIVFALRSPLPAENYAYRIVENSDDLPQLWQAPSFSFPDQHRAVVTRDSLLGRPWIADFFFTQCTSVCPVMTSRLVLLQRSLAGVDVGFVSFSVDPAHDTPEALAAYAAAWNAEETRWRLLSTAPATLAAAVAGFHVVAEPDSDRANPITHSSVFLLLDSAGWVRGVYDSNDEQAVRRLAADARRLAHPVEDAAAARVAADAPAPRGAYQSLGCAGCHENPRVAPSLVNLSGSTVRLADGSTVMADEAYLRRAILEPGGQVVAGYLPIMPGYRGALDDKGLDALVAEITALRATAPPAPPAAPAELVTDPVCRMEVRAAPETIHLQYGRHTVYFCCESCRDAFVAEPVAYLKNLNAKPASSAPQAIHR